MKEKGKREGRGTCRGEYYELMPFRRNAAIWQSWKCMHDSCNIIQLALGLILQALPLTHPVGVLETLLEIVGGSVFLRTATKKVESPQILCLCVHSVAVPVL